ncbi:universal stress protein [Fulvivirga sp. M361]|uniref:universal stress protein n=1 Tax=Fulvivirga sp. M361 TaxID=2594266 RepID=UPI00117A5382|nr:universal stress protein [Fulvivirga sp. M361]TRX60669.1 universal stress protein [Fulvivirga sp. M361]
MKINTILFPTDFSQGANLALKEAIYFAKQAKAHLEVLHVYHRPVNGERFKSLKDKEKDVELEFEALKKNHPALSEISYSFKKELGISVDRIIEIVNEGNIDMLIMVTKGARGFGELWGSKTASIIQKVDVPVIVIPNKASLHNIKTIGLAYDYSRKGPTRTLNSLVNTSELLKANLAIITVNLKERFIDAERQQVKEQMIDELHDIPYSFSYSYHDDVEEGLMTYCNQHNIGLLCIVPHTYNFIAELFHESLTQKMVFHSTIPLLVIR